MTARSNLAWTRTSVHSSTLFRTRYTVLATICASHSIHQPDIGGAKAYQLSVSGPECVCVHAIITFSGRMAEEREIRSRTMRLKRRGNQMRSSETIASRVSRSVQTNAFANTTSQIEVAMRGPP